MIPMRFEPIEKPNGKDNSILFYLRSSLVPVLADLIISVGGNNKFLLYTVIVWGSVLISAFIDNIPYVATMLPVLSGIAARTGIEPCRQ